MSDVVNYLDAPATVAWTSPTSGVASLTVTQPDGTALDPAPTVTDTSALHKATFTPTLPGRHVLHWSTADAAFVDVLDVWPTNPRFLVSREQAIERLRQLNNQWGTEFDSIMLYIAAASAVVERIIGPAFTTVQNHTAVSAHGDISVVLPAIMVTVTAVSIDGNVLSAAAYVVDDDAGVVWVDVPRRSKVSIDYTVGGAGVPIEAQMGCLEILAHSWQQTRQTAAPFPVSDVPTVTTSMGYAIPLRALEWLQRVPRAAGMA